MPDQKINGKQYCLWRAVDQDGEVVDVYLQARRDGSAAKRFLKRLLRSHAGEPRKIVTDKLRSYGVAHRELIADAGFLRSGEVNLPIPSGLLA
jgi:putative transposase